MDNVKKLNINANPYIRLYTEYAFPDAIMNNDATCGSVMLKAELSENIDEAWIKKEQNAVFSIRNNYLTMEEGYLNKPSVKYLYRPLRENDELTIRIDFQQYTNKWDAAGLFLNHKDDELGEINDHLLVLGNVCGELFLGKNVGKETFLQLNDKKKYPVYLKAKAMNDRIVFSYSLDGSNWLPGVEYEKEADFDEEKYVLGIFITLSDRQYYKWIFSNFINFKMDINDGSMMGYSIMPKRDCKNYTVNPILQISREKLAVIERCTNLWDFIVASIDEERYLEFWLNERHLPELEAYQKYDFVHENLIFGYDGNEKTLNVMSIRYGRPYIHVIKYEEFLLGCQIPQRKDAGYCYIFEYLPSSAPYDFDIEGVVRQLKELYSGYNSSKNFRTLMAEEVGYYGMKSYDRFLHDEKTAKRLLEDRRVAYFFTEHKKCMYDRVKYLIAFGYLQEDENQDILSMLENIYKVSQNLLSRILRKQVKKQKDMDKEILKYIAVMEEEEMRCYPLLIHRLEKYIENNRN